MIQTIEYQDLSYKAYMQLKELIMSGELKPGEKIAQEAIAQKLGISRMPLHKAFQMLENELLVESIPRRGIFVKENDLKIIADAFECREAIESVASRRLAQEASLEDIDRLQKLFEPFLDDPANADLIKYQRADHEFHTLVVKLTGNTLLMKMEALGNVLINSYRHGLIRSPQETLPEHFAIIDAMKNRDADKAEMLMRQHSILSRKLVLEQMRLKTES
jgi:DNA-binding GntR family transcriptional regulator